jgi:hypothetical protein
MTLPHFSTLDVANDGVVSWPKVSHRSAPLRPRRIPRALASHYFIEITHALKTPNRTHASQFEPSTILHITTNLLRDNAVMAKDALPGGASLYRCHCWPSYQYAPWTELLGPVHQTSMLLGMRDTAVMSNE